MRSPLNKLNILLADDDQDERYFFEKALKDMPVIHHLSTVPDGERLMSYLTKNQKSLPDVLFLDLNMPRKNGHECLAEIRGNKKFKDLPVVIYSTAMHEELVNTLHKNGANYFMRKSSIAELTRNVEGVLALLGENAEQPLREEFVLDLQKV